VNDPRGAEGAAHPNYGAGPLETLGDRRAFRSSLQPGADMAAVDDLIARGCSAGRDSGARLARPQAEGTRPLYGLESRLRVAGMQVDGMMDQVMATTPRPLIDSVVRSVCRREIERVVRLSGGGMNETYRVELPGEVAVVVRIAHHGVRWLIDEGHISALARGVGVPSPEVLGVEHVDHGGELLSFSIQRFVPGRSLEELVGELPAADLEQNPATPAAQRRCIEVIARYVGGSIPARAAGDACPR
jgi:hypothetical protein